MSTIILFLLTPLREGRRLADAAVSRKPHISTHAPAGGATEVKLRDANAYTISTHAPAGGATDCRRIHPAHTLHFYSRPCGRGDYGGDDEELVNVQISTHAPAGGATIYRDTYYRDPLFLLTPLREGRLDRLAAYEDIGLFLLTPLREGRPATGGLPAHGPHFYSRPCGRGDTAATFAFVMRSDFYSRPCGRGDEIGRCPDLR